MKIRLAAVTAVLAACASLAAAQPNMTPGASVDGAKIAKADADPGEWLSNGRTYSEQRFSPLAKINASNVNALGVAWEFRTNTVDRKSTRLNSSHLARSRMPSSA